MKTLAAFGCVELATAGRAVVEETRVLAILLAVLGVELFLLLSTLSSKISVSYCTHQRYYCSEGHSVPSIDIEWEEAT